MSFSNKTASSVTVTWGAATSTTTTDSTVLEYKLVYSSSNNIGSVSAAESNGTVAMDWTANTLTHAITGLSPLTTYYVAVLARDPSSNSNIDLNSVKTLCSGKIIFLTAVSNGNMGGKAGADTICNNNKPSGFSGSTFKAMLGDSSARAACYVNGNDSCSSSTTGRMDWVFTASETLCTFDYNTKIGVTDSRGLLSVTTSNVLTSSALNVFTGFNIAWGVSTSNNCANWSSTGGASPVAGIANSTGQNFYAGGFLTCASSGYIYCVEQ